VESHHHHEEDDNFTPMNNNHHKRNLAAGNIETDIEIKDNKNANCKCNIF